MVAIMRPLLALSAVLMTAAIASAQTSTPDSGVPLDVATRRAANISGLRYDMALSIPAELASPLTGEETIRFDLKDASGPLVIDFDTSRDHLKSIEANGKPVPVTYVNGHLVLPAGSLVAGANAVKVAFTAGNDSLNRSADFLYTLFVPARARLAFPVFDQPDLKGRWTLTLDHPAAAGGSAWCAGDPGWCGGSPRRTPLVPCGTGLSHDMLHRGNWPAGPPLFHRSGAAGAWRNKFIRAPHYSEHAAARGILSSTFETSMTWDRMRDFHTKITKITRDTIKQVTGRDGFVTCRFTHVYPDGPCLYFTFGGLLDKRKQLEQFMQVLTTCTAATVEHGGTTTHHHAVGRFHRPFYDKQRPELFARALRGAKRELDPKGMMNPGVLIDP